MTSRQIGLLQGYSAVIFMGAGITIIQTLPIPSPTLVWYRVAIALPVLCLYAFVRKTSLHISRAYWKPLFFTGLLTGTHWISLFLSIKLSTVALGMISFYTFPVFTTLLEAGVQKRKPLTRDLLVTLITLAGVILLTPLTGASAEFLPGLLLGILSATLWAGRTVLIHHTLKELPSLTTMIWSLGIVLLFLSPTTLKAPAIWNWDPGVIKGTLFLGLFVTAFCHTLILSSLRRISATLLGQIAPVQIVSASITGWYFLKEPLTPRIIIGGSLIAFTGLIAATFFKEKPKRPRTIDEIRK